MEMVWAHNKTNWTCKDRPTGYGKRREKGRQTEIEIGRWCIRIDRIRVGWSPSKGWGQRGMEKSGCPIILDATTIIQTTGWVRVSEKEISAILARQSCLPSNYLSCTNLSPVSSQSWTRHCCSTNVFFPALTAKPPRPLYTRIFFVSTEPDWLRCLRSASGTSFNWLCIRSSVWWSSSG